ncbi:MAG: YceI family protein [Balneolaceae bacterium]
MYQRIIITPILLLFLSLGTLFAQEVTLDLVTGSELTIDGTSNIRDWDATTTTLDAELILAGAETTLQSLSPEQFISLTLSLPVESLDSGTRGLNNNMHKYLKSDVQPNIRFELGEISEITQTDNGITLTATGTVFVAGESIEVTMSVDAATNSEGEWVFSGSQPLKMTDFGISPPTAVFGTVRAVDDVTILYNIRFRK